MWLSCLWLAGISVGGNQPVEQPSRISKWETKSEYANQPSGPEQTSQIRDSVPADMNFTFGGDDMQLPQAILHPEPGIH